MRRNTRLSTLPIAAALVAIAACGDDNNLAPASIPNVVDTVTLGALTSSPISLASAFSVADGDVVRTDLSSAFDFAYDVDPAGRHVFLTTEVLDLHTGASGTGPGLQKVNSSFAGLTTAPINGYVTTDTVVVDSGMVFAVRSRIVCTGLGVPIYGKLEILSISDAPGNNQITFQALSDENCGYKSLTPGLPKE